VKTISTEEESDVINQLENGERIVDKGCNVRCPPSSVLTLSDNVERITESVNSETKVFVSVTK
jgi:hypothetical protein